MLLQCQVFTPPPPKSSFTTAVNVTVETGRRGDGQLPLFLLSTAVLGSKVNYATRPCQDVSRGRRDQR